MCLDSELLPDCVKSGHLGLSSTKLILRQLNLESSLLFFSNRQHFFICLHKTIFFFHFVYSKRYIYKFNLFI